MTDIIYLRLENDLEYNSRLEFVDIINQNIITSLKIQANKLGYKLEKINHTPSAINEQCGTY